MTDYAIKVANFEVGGGLARSDRFQGREHLVVPVVALRPQVVQCDGCTPPGELVPAEEIAASFRGWEGRPVTLGHPRSPEGFLVSANSKEALQTEELGKFFNVNIREDGALIGEIWLDVSRAMSKLEGGELLRKFRDGKEVLNVSTGYFRLAEKTSGEHEGRPFALIQRNLTPDHLAILIDQKGACSVADGCGAPRINSGGMDMPEKNGEDQKPVTVNVDSEGIGTAIANGMKDFFSKFANREQVMEREKTIADLAGCDCVGLSKEELEKQSDEGLAALVSLKERAEKAEAKATEKAEGKGEKPEPAANSKGADGDEASKGAAEGKNADAEKLVEQIGNHLAEKFKLDKLPDLVADAEARATAEKESKDAVIERLKANDKNVLSEESLKALSLTDLEKHERALKPASYLGAGGPGNGGVTANEEAYAKSPSFADFGFGPKANQKKDN